MSFCLAHSGHRISGPSVMKPLPTKEDLHIAQMKQSLCQVRSSKEMNRVPPMPRERKQNVISSEAKLLTIGRERF